MVVRNESIDIAVELYNTLVPHIWSPSIDFYKYLIKEIDVQGAQKHLPKIWTDLQSMSFCSVSSEGRMEFYERFSAAMRNADLPISPDLSDSESEEMLGLLKVNKISLRN